VVDALTDRAKLAPEETGYLEVHGRLVRSLRLWRGSSSKQTTSNPG
jgi:hypothetical protein